MIEIDGSFGEGGGQILRSALSLSMITGQPVVLTNIRANRDKPGLLRQHLTAVKAAACLCNGQTEGAELKSRTLAFAPGRIVPGDYTFSVGTAGSATLVLQTLLPALMTAGGASRLVLEGGTHNQSAPPFDFVKDSFAPLLHKMGVGLALALERPGFYPVGGGRFVAEIAPTEALQPLYLEARGRALPCRARSIVANVSEQIAERELRALERDLKWDDLTLRPEVDSRAVGTGNILLLYLPFEEVCEVISCVGRRGLSSDAVARTVANAAWQYLATDAPVGEHLADQLLLPMAICGEGSFVTGALSMHTRTNIAVIERFFGPCIFQEPLEGGRVRLRIDRKERG